MRTRSAFFGLAATLFRRSRNALTALLICWSTAAFGGSAGPFTPPVAVALEAGRAEEDSSHTPTPERHVSRALAAALAVTLGPFGAHRLYLGTKPKVPLLYGLTFGGFGVLVLIDLGHILFTRDLSPYMDNDKVLMWAAPQEEVVTPP